jgi:hypothetical protein
MQGQRAQGVPDTHLDIELVDDGLAEDDLTVMRKEVEVMVAAVVKVMAAAVVEVMVAVAVEVMEAMEEEMVAAAMEDLELDVEEMAKGLALLEKYLRPSAQRKWATTCKGLLKTNERKKYSQYHHLARLLALAAVPAT